MNEFLDIDHDPGEFVTAKGVQIDGTPGPSYMFDHALTHKEHELLSDAWLIGIGAYNRAAVKMGGRLIEFASDEATQTEGKKMASPKSSGPDPRTLLDAFEDALTAGDVVAAAKAAQRAIPWLERHVHGVMLQRFAGLILEQAEVSDDH